MKPRLSTLFFLLCLFVALSANRAWACGDNNPNHVKQFHHVHKYNSPTHHHHTMTESSNHGAEKKHDCDSEGSNAPCSDDDSGHCHCPGCGTAGNAPVVFAPVDDIIFNPFLCDASVQRQAYYFAEHLPEAVYIAIWQPPKLMA